MIDPDPAKLTGSVPVRRIQEDERIPLSIDGGCEHALDRRELSTEALVHALVVRRNSDRRRVIDPAEDHDPAERIADWPHDPTRSPRRRDHGPVPVEGDQLVAV